MLNKFSRSIRKYPFFYSTLFLGIVGTIFRLTNKLGVSDLFFIMSALVAIVIGIKIMLDVFRHGYFGMPLLLLTGLVTALLLKQTEAAAVLALVLSMEQATYTWIQNKFTKTTSLLQVKHVQFVRFLDTASLPFMLLVLLIGIAVWFISGESTRFLEVIAAASTVPLLLAAPVHVLSGMNKLNRTGVNVPTAVLFEKLADIKTVVLRKSATLTQNEVKVTDVRTFGKHTKQEVLKVASALASQSTHRISRAIVDHTGNSQKVDRAKHAGEIPGQGVSGRMKGSNLIIGRKMFLRSNGVAVDSVDTVSDGPEVFVGRDGELLGIIYLKETTLDNIENFEKKLNKAGVLNVILVSGSNTDAVTKVSGIKRSHSNTVQNDIIKIIDEEKNVPVAFIGKYKHDEAIATAADLNISLSPDHSGSAVTIDDYSPTKLLATFRIAKKVMGFTQKLVIFMLVISLLVILWAATGRLTATEAAGLNLAMLIGYTGFEIVRSLTAKNQPQ